MTAEQTRLDENRDRQAYWLRWGPYLSERQWGTVREDYSQDGNAWSYISYDCARSRAYRWGEDGIAGISDNHQRLCFAIALWNERDPILKERLFGVTGPQGNHGEDVKEAYFYLDNTPSHAYMKYLYKYPQGEFPYADLVRENERRSAADPEYELLDTGIFEGNRYFDVTVTYAKETDEDISICIKVCNRGDTAKPLHLLPTLWFRNTWSWQQDAPKPILSLFPSREGIEVIRASHHTLGDRWLYCEGATEIVFTENETNTERLYGTKNRSIYVKDGINDRAVLGKMDAVNPSGRGTKASAYYVMELAPGETKTLRLRLSDRPPHDLPEPFANFEERFEKRRLEADEFYQKLLPETVSGDRRNIYRQAMAGLLWTKQYYYFVVEEWLNGDPAQPPVHRHAPRNAEWVHLYNDDIISMPDKWEFPWYAAWDLAFHAVPFATIDPDFAKYQLDRLTREWYMHPNGQLPAYEWHFSDVNPPVHAWGAWRVYQIEKANTGKGDRQFLERVFQKLLLNFTWWVNRKDTSGKNVFEGGFLGLDNIGIFNRSADVPAGGRLEQSDATSWMAMYALNMLEISIELAKDNPVYEDIASKFFEHFLYIASAMNHPEEPEINLWDDEDKFYYDVLHTPDDERHPLKVKSMVGLIPLFAVLVMELEDLDRFPKFKQRVEWFKANRPHLASGIASLTHPGEEGRKLLALVSPNKLRAIIKRMLDETEFLSDYGVRSLSREHLAKPFTFEAEAETYCISYEPAESNSGMFGGNSNWRGPVWFPVNYLIVESLHVFYRYLGDDFQVECPTGSGKWMNLGEVANEISRRLIAIFELDEDRRPVHGDRQVFQSDPHWHELILFNEYFHGDNGSGLGANHQTGWSALVASLIQESAALAMHKDSAEVSARSGL